MSFVAVTQLYTCPVVAKKSSPSPIFMQFTYIVQLVLNLIMAEMLDVELQPINKLKPDKYTGNIVLNLFVEVDVLSFQNATGFKRS